MCILRFLPIAQSLLLFLSCCLNARADFIVGGTQVIRAADASQGAVTQSATIDIPGAPSGHMQIDPSPGVGSMVDNVYLFGQTIDEVSMSWNIGQRRSDQTTSSSSSWYTEVVFSSNSDFDLSLNANWNGQSITNGATVIAIQLYDDQNFLIDDSRSYIDGTATGGVLPVYARRLLANQNYTLTMQTVLFFLSDQNLRQTVSATGQFDLTLTAVPEPSNVLLIVTALGFCGLNYRQRTPRSGATAGVVDRA